MCQLDASARSSVHNRRESTSKWRHISTFVELFFLPSCNPLTAPPAMQDNGRHPPERREQNGAGLSSSPRPKPLPCRPPTLLRADAKHRQSTRCIIRRPSPLPRRHRATLRLHTDGTTGPRQRWASWGLEIFLDRLPYLHPPTPSDHLPAIIISRSNTKENRLRRRELTGNHHLSTGISREMTRGEIRSSFRLWALLLR